MVDDYDFISNVKALATNGTLGELLSRLEEDAVLAWKRATTNLLREECWHTVHAVQLLKAKIESFNNDEKVRLWVNQKMTRRV